MSDYISKLVPRSAHRKTNTNPEFLKFLSRNVLSIQLLKYCYLHLLMYSIKTDLQTCNFWTGQSILLRKDWPVHSFKEGLDLKVTSP